MHTKKVIYLYNTLINCPECFLFTIFTLNSPPVYTKTRSPIGYSLSAVSISHTSIRILKSLSSLAKLILGNKICMVCNPVYNQINQDRSKRVPGLSKSVRNIKCDNWPFKLKMHRLKANSLHFIQIVTTALSRSKCPGPEGRQMSHIQTYLTVETITDLGGDFNRLQGLSSSK